MTQTTKQLTADAAAILQGERLLPVEALCARWHVHRRTVTRWVQEGRLQAVRLSGAKVLFRVADVVEFERGSQ